MTDEGKRCRQGIRCGLGIRRIGIGESHQLLREVLRLGIDELEVHRGIILTGCLVDVDIEAVVALHLERGLHTCLREHCHRGVVPVHGFPETLTDL